MEALQNEKIIASASARFSDEKPFDFLPPWMDSTIPKPLDCLTIKEARAGLPFMDPWLDKHGSALDLITLKPKGELFELRPVDFESYGAMNSKSKKMQCWARLAPHLHRNLYCNFTLTTSLFIRYLDIDIKEPMFVPITICDYLACQPVITVLDQQRLHFRAGASITHKVYIHRTTGFNVSLSL
jgi:hypothetical protein